MKKNNFCSILSKTSGEPIAGSAPYAEHFIFISWPKKYWGYEALEASGGFPKGLKNWMKENSKVYGKISIRLASKEDTSNDNSDIFIFPGENIYRSVSPKKILKILDKHFQQKYKPTCITNKSNHEQIFICTHGRHDKCCAKYGQKVADLMRCQVEKQDLNIEIWESSHLGGHRFAATLIDFPKGFSYGRLTPDEIPIFLKFRKENKIYTPAYRGSVFLSGFEQIVEAHIQHYVSIKKLFCKVEIINIDRISEKKFTCIAKLINNISEKHKVYFNKPLSFSFILKEFENPSGCDSLDESELRKCWQMQLPINI